MSGGISITSPGRATASKTGHSGSRIPPLTGEHVMPRTVCLLALTAMVRGISTGSAGIALVAQTSSNPYHVTYNWDKLQGRKVGVASGIKMDPDGRHIWVLDRCGANGCAESDLDPIIQADFDG